MHSTMFSRTSFMLLVLVLFAQSIASAPVPGTASAPSTPSIETSSDNIENTSGSRMHCPSPWPEHGGKGPICDRTQ
ncbi:hypothetical protein B0O80DRAFT_452110 [Mortierella sp. GBAus27b]|nr:hypothetical protein B0O80DRAFT_452110 [Mortierella sp. GBAus27b]